jgi:hypothetical protein
MHLEPKAGASCDESTLGGVTEMQLAFVAKELTRHLAIRPSG